jgi:hypothetical protein
MFMGIWADDMVAILLNAVGFCHRKREELAAGVVARKNRTSISAIFGDGLN